MGPAYFLNSKFVGAAEASIPQHEKIQVIVTSVLHCKMMSVPLDDLVADGSEDLTDAIDGMRSYYNDLKPEDEVTVIKFSLP